MSQGLLSEGRTLPEETVTDASIFKTEPLIIKTEPTVVDPPLFPEPEPTLNLPFSTEPIKGKSCLFCSASAIANLSFRFALVVFVLALSISVLKSGGTKNA